MKTGSAKISSDPSFFAANREESKKESSTRELSKKINDKQTITITNEDGYFAKLHDVNDECMKSIIESFSLENFCKDGISVSGFQARFYLKSLELMDVVYKPCFTEAPHKDYILTKCAAASILKKLNEKMDATQDCVTFQARGKKIGLSGISPIILKPNEKEEYTYNLIERHKTVSNVYAYLDEGWLCIFMNKPDEAQEELIRNTLKSLFPENPAQPILEQTTKESTTTEDQSSLLFFV